MRAYTVLIVDDERNIAEGLKLLIERFVPQCQVLGIALDGMQGYKVALDIKPEIILTDIHMPQFDGIEMIRRLKEAGCESRYIILSGFAEFEYAKSAIALGVDGYIMKPVEESELISTFDKVCHSLKNKMEQLKQFDDLKNTINEYELQQILETHEKKADEIRRKLLTLGFPMDGKGYLSTVWMNNDAAPNELFHQHLKEMTGQHPASCNTRLVIPITEDIVALILIFPRMGEDQYIHEIEKMRMLLARKIKSVVSVGVGLCHDRAEYIHESYKEARCALNYTVVKGTGCVISYAEINDISTNQNLVALEDLEQLESCIDTMDDEGCRQVINSIFDKIEKKNNVNLFDLQILSLNLILSGIRKVPFMQLQLNNYLESNILSMENISKFKTIEQLKNFIINMLKSVNDLILKENISERRDIIVEIKEYINQNYNKDISLNDIAKRFFINPYYLSQLYKKRTGETYQAYLTKIRISRAKRLLRETDMKLYEVSAMIGYSDATYFNKKFELAVGMKPGEYRLIKED